MRCLGSRFETVAAAGLLKKDMFVDVVIHTRSGCGVLAAPTSAILRTNKLRLEGNDIIPATYQASLLRLRPIMMTALVACLGLLPAALSTGIGSDSQKPFAIVIVAGLVSRLFLGRIVSPVLYQMVAKPGDVLQV